MFSLKNLFARADKIRSPRRPIRLHLEQLETRIVPVVNSLSWAPQSNFLASNGQNWLGGGGNRGKSPLDLPGSQINFGANGNSPITWDNPGPGQNEVYSLGTVTLTNGYTALETINKTVSVEAGGAITSPATTKLNLSFLGPSRDTTNGSFYYVASNSNTVINLSLQGSGSARAGNFIVEQGASLTLGAGANETLSVKNTEFDVYGGLYLQPDAGGNYSSLTLGQSSLLVSMSNTGIAGTITTHDAGYGTPGIKIVDSSDSSGNLIWVYPQASLNINLTTTDWLNVPVLNNGLMSVTGNGTNPALVVQAAVPSAYGYGYSIDNVALANQTQSGYLYLWQQVTLTLDSGYYQAGADSTHTAILQSDTNGNTIYDEGDVMGLFFGTNSSVIFATTPVPFGTLYLEGNVTFDANYQPLVDTTQARWDQIYVVGNLSFGSSAFIIPVTYGSGSFKGPWQVFVCTGTWTNWASVGFQYPFYRDPNKLGWIDSH